MIVVVLLLHPILDNRALGVEFPTVITTTCIEAVALLYVITASTQMGGRTNIP